MEKTVPCLLDELKSLQFKREKLKRDFWMQLNTLDREIDTIKHELNLQTIIS